VALNSLTLKEIPVKSIVLLQENVNSIDRIFLYHMVFDSIKAGKKVLYLAVNRDSDDILSEMSSYSFFDSSLLKKENITIKDYFNNLAQITEISPEYDVCIVDPFSFLIINKDHHHITDFILALKKISRKDDIIFFLCMDDGISDKKTENVMMSLVDGIIQFKETIVGRRVERYIHILKLKGKIPMNDLIPVIIKEDGISVDTRQTIR
jgi:KaiC/GvpD/RAD55 family RecA-like ATPase